MLAHLSRTTRRPYSSSIFVERSTLFVNDEGKLTRKDLASPEEALAEHAKLVAKREKAGWKTHMQIASPWLDYRSELEDVFTRVVSDARASNVPVDERIGKTYFARASGNATPPENLRDKIPVDDYMAFAQIGGVTLTFHLGDDKLSFTTEFVVGNPWRNYDWSTEKWFWRRLDNRKATDGGVFENGKLVSRVSDNHVAHESADDFRTWFRRYVRDDVMGFTIAELAR